MSMPAATAEPRRTAAAAAIWDGGAWPRLPAANAVDRVAFAAMLAELGGETMAAVIGAFREEALARIERLEAAAAAGNGPAFARLAHSVAGSAAIVGGHRLAAVARHAMTSCAEGPRDLSARLLPEFRHLIEQTMRELEPLQQDLLHG
jgi:HPt (histidine-containing phosphotransfer) domain-containing protein